MRATVEELAALVGGRIVGSSGAVPITGAASIAEAQEGDITFFGNIKYLSALKTSRATCALVPEGFTETIPALQIRVGNPSLAFSKIIERFAPAPIRKSKRNLYRN